MINILIFISLLIIFFQSLLIDLTGINFINSFDEIITVIIFVYSIIHIIKIGKINKSSIILLIFTFVFFIVGIMSYYCYNNHFDIIALKSGFLSIKFWLVVFSISTFKIDNKFIERIIKDILIFEKIVLIFAIINLFMPSFFLKLFPSTIVSYRFGIMSISSLFLHPGKFGWFMLFCFIIRLVGLNYYDFESKGNYLWLVVDLLFALLSFRTKVILGFVSVIVVYELLYKTKSFVDILKKTSPILISIVVIGFIFKSVLFNTYELYFTDKYGTSARQALNVNSLKILKDNFPLGVGFGKYASWFSVLEYSDVYYKYGLDTVYGLQPSNPWYATDVFWPSIIGETGVIGTSIYIFLILYTLKNIYKYLKKNKNYKDFINLELVAFLLLIQTIIESFGEASFNSSPQNIIVALFVGVAFADIIRKRKGETI